MVAKWVGALSAVFSDFFDFTKFSWSDPEIGLGTNFYRNEIEKKRALKKVLSAKRRSKIRQEQ